jgi:ankyrin repeat protein
VTNTATQSYTWPPPTDTPVSPKTDSTHRIPLFFCPTPIRARELLDLLLPLSSPTLLSAQNNAGSTALHWAAINAQLPAARALVAYPDGPGARLIDVKNAAGRSPLGEAEAAGWDEGAKWMVEVMHLDDADDDDKNGRDESGAVEEDGEGLSEQPNAAEVEGSESGEPQS